MRKLHLHLGLIATLLITATTSTAQQYSKLWLWQQNAFSVSPALIGVNPGVDVSAYYANNFSNLNNSLTNMGVMASGQLPGTSAGMGINISRESIGFENVFNGTIAYNYGIKLNSDYGLKLGLSLGIIYQNFNTNGLYFHDLNESTITAIRNNPERSAFDANVGAAFIAKDFYFGITANRFLKNELEYEANKENYSFLYDQKLSAIGGYTFRDISQNYDIKANVIFETQKNSPSFAMANAELHYRKLIWAGVGYGTGNLFAASFGVKLKHDIKFAYLYHAGSINNDFHLGDGHEIMMTATLGKSHIKPKYRIVEKIIPQEVIVKDTIYVTRTDTVYREMPSEGGQLASQENTNSTSNSQNLENGTVDVEGDGTLHGEKANSNSQNNTKDNSQSHNTQEDNNEVVEDKMPSNPKPLKNKEGLKKDEQNNIVIDDLVPLNNEKIDTTNMIIKDVSKSTIKQGHYVVIGTFGVQENADILLKSMMAEGKQCFKFYDPSNEFYYIYIYYSENYDEAAQVKNSHLNVEGIWVKEIR